MKKILSKLFILSSVLIGFLFAGCSENDDPFEGTDNYITSFSLTKDGITYKVAIAENRLEISAPKSIDLKGATAEYKLTELASISPDPKTITDWSENQKFTVTSRNSTLREYNYQVSHTDISEVGSVVLLTQEDVDKFAASNIEVIDGNLIIGTNEVATEIDSIKKLDGLQSLKKVTNSVIIYNSFASENLDGLKNIENVGSLYIKNLTTRKTVADSLDINLPNLKEVGDLHINSTILRKVLLPKLKSAFSFYINAQSLSELELPALETVITDLGVESGTSFTSTSNGAYNKKFKNLLLKNLKEIQGSFTLRGLAALENVDISQLENIGSDFTITQVNTLKKLSIPLLQRVKGIFSMKGVEGIENMSSPKLSYVGSFIFNSDSYIWTNTKTLKVLDFSKLETVQKDFKISDVALETLDFPSLKKVGNEIYADDCEFMTTVNIPVLEDCQTITLSSSPLVTSFDISKIKELNELKVSSCYKLALVKGANNVKNVSLNGGSRLCDLTQLEGITIIPGTFSINSYTMNSEFIYKGVKQVGTFDFNNSGIRQQTVLELVDMEIVGTLKIGTGYNFISIKAPKLKEITDLWDSSFMQFIKSGDIKILNLKKIGTFVFYGGTYSGAASMMPLTDLNDFRSLEKIDKVEIKWWGNMTDFSGLKNIISKIEKENWSVDGCAYNPTYQDMKDGKYVKP